MRIMFINGSSRKNGTVVRLLKVVREGFAGGDRSRRVKRPVRNTAPLFQKPINRETP